MKRHSGASIFLWILWTFQEYLFCRICHNGFFCIYKRKHAIWKANSLASSLSLLLMLTITKRRPSTSANYIVLLWQFRITYIFPKVLSMLNNGSVEQVHSKEYYFIFTYIFLVIFYCSLSKNLCCDHFYFYLFIYFFFWWSFQLPHLTNTSNLTN